MMLEILLEYSLNAALIIFGFSIIVTISIFLSQGWGAPWVITPTKKVKKMLQLAELKPGDVLVDLGAGDGRILIAAAKKYSVKTVGYEIDPLRYLLGKIFIRLNGVQRSVRLVWGDMFKADLRAADVVTIYLTRPTNNKLKTIFEEQLRPGTRVVSYSFPIKGWAPIIIDDNYLIFVYEVGNTSEDIKTIFVT